jgi:hypothetical protein
MHDDLFLKSGILKGRSLRGYDLVSNNLLRRSSDKNDIGLFFFVGFLNAALVTMVILDITPCVCSKISRSSISIVSY